MSTKSIGDYNRLIGRARTAEQAEAALEKLRDYGVGKADLKAVQATLKNPKLPPAVAGALKEFVRIQSTTIRGPVLNQIKREFMRYQKEINWSFTGPQPSYGTRLYTQVMSSPRSSREPTLSIVMVINPGDDPNSLSQYWIKRFPAASEIRPGARVAPMYAGPFERGDKVAWPPAPDWNPHPIALYAVAVDRAVSEGNQEVIKNVLAAVKRVRSKIQTGTGPQLAAMSFTASAGGGVGLGVDATLAKYETKLAAAANR